MASEPISTISNEELSSAFKMPDDYKEWIQDVERVHNALTALTYAHYALVQENSRRHPAEAMVTPDDIPTWEAVKAIQDSIDSLQAFCIGYGVPVMPIERGEAVGREVCRYFPGGHQ